jgi:hypothetical protein
MLDIDTLLCKDVAIMKVERKNTTWSQHIGNAFNFALVVMLLVFPLSVILFY